jgi:small conductance mechanosensitive channel
MDLNTLTQSTVVTLTALAWKIAGALALWLVGRWLIGFALRLLSRGLARQNVDATLTRYLQTGLSAVLNVALVVAILGYFGVETTTFAALLAAGGVAIGVAWGGLLANFAAGAFLVFLRPFKVGDFVTAAGVTGPWTLSVSSARRSILPTTSSRSSVTTRCSRTRFRIFR